MREKERCENGETKGQKTDTDREGMTDRNRITRRKQQLADAFHHLLRKLPPGSAQVRCGGGGAGPGEAGYISGLIER